MSWKSSTKQYKKYYYASELVNIMGSVIGDTLLCLIAFTFWNPVGVRKGRLITSLPFLSSFVPVQCSTISPRHNSLPEQRTPRWAQTLCSSPQCISAGVAQISPGKNLSEFFSSRGLWTDRKRPGLDYHWRSKSLSSHLRRYWVNILYAVLYGRFLLKKFQIWITKA